LSFTLREASLVDTFSTTTGCSESRKPSPHLMPRVFEDSGFRFCPGSVLVELQPVPRPQFTREFCWGVIPAVPSLSVPHHTSFCVGRVDDSDLMTVFPDLDASWQYTVNWSLGYDWNSAH